MIDETLREVRYQAFTREVQVADESITLPELVVHVEELVVASRDDPARGEATVGRELLHFDQVAHYRFAVLLTNRGVHDGDLGAIREQAVGRFLLLVLGLLKA